MNKELIDFTDKEPRINLSGQKFNRLTIIKPVGRYRRAVVYLCKCDCGKELMISSTQVKTGSSKSCGCLQRDILSKLMTKHGMWDTPTYHSWNGMKDRCKNPKSTFYSYYGGRGIKVCKRWEIFENFFEDMGEAPKHLTIDRIDSNSGYFKENCKWSSREEQIRNRRNSLYFMYKGETKYLKDWADDLGISYSVLWSRLRNYNWSVVRAFTTPLA